MNSSRYRGNTSFIVGYYSLQEVISGSYLPQNTLKKYSDWNQNKTSVTITVTVISKKIANPVLRIPSTVFGHLLKKKRRIENR